jgi:hypothetical protein
MLRVFPHNPLYVIISRSGQDTGLRKPRLDMLHVSCKRLKPLRFDPAIFSEAAHPCKTNMRKLPFPSSGYRPEARRVQDGPERSMRT